MRRIFWNKLLFLFFVSPLLYGQSMISLKFMPVGVYPLGNSNSTIMSGSIDSAGKYIIEPGLNLSYQLQHASANLAIKLLQGAYFDGAGFLSGFTHFEIRGRIFEYYKHSLEIGIGPTMHYRRSWSAVEGYQDEGLFQERRGWQYKMSWLSGEIEYNLGIYNRKKKRVDLSLSINHHAPQGLTLSIGARYWLNKNKKRGPCNCPSFH